MSKLLINETPLIVLPSLATKIGLNEAIILQQVHFWVSVSKHHYDGRAWVFNTIADWGKQFPFFSESTIKRTLSTLRERGLVLATDQYNSHPVDRKLWYTVDYDAVEMLENTPATSHQVNLTRSSSHPDTMSLGQIDPLTNRDSRILTENTRIRSAHAEEEAHYVRSEDAHYVRTSAEPGKPTEGKANPFSVKGKKVSKTNGQVDTEQETSLYSPDNNSLCEQEPTLTGKQKKAANPMTKPILDAYVEVHGANGINYGKEAKYAKMIAEQGNSPELVKECYAWMKAQEFWRYKPLGLAKIFESLPEYISFKSGKPQAVHVQATMLDYAFDEDE